MSIRVLCPDGKLITVMEVVAYLEKVEVWNGKRRRNLEAARNLSEANALVIKNCPCNITIGNLSPSQVKEIQQNMLKFGYADLTTLLCKIVKEEKEIRVGDTQPPYFLAGDRRANEEENRRMEDIFGSQVNAFGCQRECFAGWEEELEEEDTTE